MINKLFWKMIGKIVSYPAVADYLIARAKLTPYSDLPDYMERWWVFNDYDSPKFIKWLPSYRIHHILREDYAPDPHSHPWNARTIILKGNYIEKRLKLDSPLLLTKDYEYYTYNRNAGNTATLTYDDYHNIVKVSAGGVWTLFITYKKKDKWGFLVDGVKIPSDEYTGRA